MSDYYVILVLKVYQECPDNDGSSQNSSYIVGIQNIITISNVLYPVI